MKIAHIGTSCMPIRIAQGGAVERRMVELARAQAAMGMDARICSAEPENGRWSSDGVAYEAARVRTPRPYRDYEFLAALHRRLRGDPPDLVHAHNAPDIGRLARRLGIPAVYTFDYFRLRATRWRAGRAYYRRSLATYSVLLPVSEACGAEFARFWNSPPGPMTVFYNGVNTAQFFPSPEAARSLRAELRLEGRPVVLYVGRICEQKGTDVLLEAWSRVRDRFPEAALVLAGPIRKFTDSSEGSPLTERLHQLGGTHLGAVPDDLLNAVYNLCDVFVMPTRQDEMFGMAALEAQACGKPVVASRLGGLRESVGPSSGLFFTPGDADELASALCELLASPDRRARMAAAAIGHARSFSWESLASRSLEIYESVLSQTTARAVARSMR